MEERKILKQLPLCIGDINAVGANHLNRAQGFKFRSINDVYAAVNEVFAKHGVTIEPRYQVIRDETGSTKSGTPQRMVLLKGSFTLYADDGSSITVETYGEGIDTSDKAFYKAQTGALKYCLFQTLQIPTNDTTDPEIETPEIPTPPPSTEPLPF